MNQLQNGRRHALIRIVSSVAAGAAGALGSRHAVGLERPAGQVILTVTGALNARNDAQGANFDLALFERLPQDSFSTRTPWYPQPRKFNGVLVSELLKVLDTAAVSVRAVALNDYRVDIPVDDLVQHGAMIASRLDDKPIAVRDKGPLLIIYPFDAKPELRTAVHYSRAIWQLRSLELR
jgi:hypothetical protein